MWRPVHYLVLCCPYCNENVFAVNMVIPCSCASSEGLLPGWWQFHLYVTFLKGYPQTEHKWRGGNRLGGAVAVK